MERFWPVIRHARRSERPRRSCSMQDRLAPPGRAQKFPRAISFRARFSSSLSATIRFS